MHKFPDGWFECQGPPKHDGRYLVRMDEDDEESEYEIRIVKGGKVFKEDGTQRLVWNVQWKRID